MAKTEEKTDPDAAADESPRRDDEEHRAAREGDPVAAADFRDGDPYAYLAGLGEEIEGYENRIKLAEREGDSERKKLYTERIKGCRAEVARVEDLIADAEATGG